MDAFAKNSAVLMFLSRYNTRNQTEESYQECITPKGQTFRGLQTNDAPCKFLLSYGQAQGMPVTKIYCLVSQEDLKPIRLPDGSLSKDSSFTWFKTMIGDYALSQGLSCPQILMLTYDCEAGDQDILSGPPQAAVPIEERASHVYSQLLEAIKQDKPDGISVDFTGGMRDTSFLLLELSRFLRFMGIPCQQIVYSSREDLTIRSLSTAYPMFPLLTGINSFLTTGNASQLQALYRDSESSQASSLLSHLVSFSGAISLCTLQNIDRDYQNIADSLTQLEELDDDGLDLDVLMLKDFVPEIRKKLYLTGRSGGATYPDLIQWCLDNDLLQQALTLYVEKIPVYLFSKGYLRFDSPITPDNKKSTDIIRLGNIVGELSRDEKMIRLDQQIRELYQNYRQRQEEEDWTDGETAEKLVRSMDYIPYGSELTVLMQDIKSCYDGWGIRRGTAKPGWMTPAQKKKMTMPKNALGYLNIASTNPDVKYHCIHPEHRGERPNGDPHILALRNLKACMEGKISLDISGYTDLPMDRFYGLMVHYMIVRALRNQINHAADRQNTDVLRYCTEIGALPGEDVNQYTIKDAISAGIQNLRTLEA